MNFRAYKLSGGAQILGFLALECCDFIIRAFRRPKGAFANDHCVGFSGISP